MDTKSKRGLLVETLIDDFFGCYNFEIKDIKNKFQQVLDSELDFNTDVSDIAFGTDELSGKVSFYDEEGVFKFKGFTVIKNDLT